MARILIVDDMAEIRRLLTRSLKGDHEIVGELSDGYAAASEVEELHPDIVIMDHKMPLIDGERATRMIKAVFPHVVVIGFTSGGVQSTKRYWLPEPMPASIRRICRLSGPISVDAGRRAFA